MKYLNDNSPMIVVDVPCDPKITHLFAPSGIDVMNVQEFLQVFNNSNLPDHVLLSPTGQ